MSNARSTATAIYDKVDKTSLGAASGVATLDSSAKLTASQFPTITGDITISPSWVASISASGVTAGTYQTATSIRPFTVDASGRITSVGADTTITPSWSNITSKPTINGSALTGSSINLVGYDSDFKRINNPGGAKLDSLTSSVTGAIAVVLPVGWGPQMIRFTLKIYNYSASGTCDVHISGYPYAGGFWINQTAYIIGQRDTEHRFAVRFGYTAGGKLVVYVGETNTVWVYPKAYVTEVFVGHSLQSVAWESGWSITTVTAFENVSATVTADQTSVSYAATTNVANSLIKRDSSGNFSAGTITASLAGNATTVSNGVYTTGTYTDPAWITSINYSKLTGTVPTWNQNTTGSAATLTTARNINGVSFNGSADITISANTTNTLTIGSYLTGGSFNGSAATTIAVDATTTNTANKIVARDGNGAIYSTLMGINGVNYISGASASSSSVAQFSMARYRTSAFQAIEFVLVAIQGNIRHATKILATHDGTTAIGNEYGTLKTSSALFVVDVDISGGNLRLLITPTSTTATTYKLAYAYIS